MFPTGTGSGAKPYTRVTLTPLTDTTDGRPCLRACASQRTGGKFNTIPDRYSTTAALILPDIYLAVHGPPEVRTLQDRQAATQTAEERVSQAQGQKDVLPLTVRDYTAVVSRPLIAAGECDKFRIIYIHLVLLCEV